MLPISNPDTQPRLGPTTKSSSGPTHTSSETNSKSFPHLHRVPLAPDAAELYVQYTERVLLPHYFPWAFDIITRDSVLSKATTIVDVAGGCGNFLLALSSQMPHFRSGFLIDGSPGCICFAEKLYANSGFNIKCALQDMHKLSFADASFDIGIFHDSLHHSSEPFLALTELARVSRDRVFVADLSPDADKKAVSDHLSLIRESFDVHDASIMEHRFLESIDVSYPTEQVASWIKELGARIISLHKRGLGYAMVATLSR